MGSFETNKSFYKWTIEGQKKENNEALSVSIFLQCECMKCVQVRFESTSGKRVLLALISLKANTPYQL